MSPREEIVFLVDDDARVREAVGELLESLGWRAETFASAADYVAQIRRVQPHGPYRVLGWSLGGLMARALAWHQPEPVRAVITMGSPLSAQPSHTNVAKVFQWATGLDPTDPAVRTMIGGHPPVPLTDFVANIEFEMIGAQDPKLPSGSLMMTGFDRSNMGAVLTQHGALVSADPYPDQNFFERSDNYSLALKGIVAHTLSGWATVPTYHQPSDTVEALDIAFMTRAIRSLVRPIRSLANSSARPATPV